MDSENYSFAALLSLSSVGCSQLEHGDDAQAQPQACMVAKTSRSGGEDLPQRASSDISDVHRKLFVDMETLIQIVSCDRDPTGLETERLLDRMYTLVRRQVRSEDVREGWLDDCIKLVVRLVWIQPWQVKAHKKLIKVLTELERYGGETVRAELRVHTPILSDAAATRQELNTWSNMIEGSAVTRGLIGEHLPHLVVLLNTKLTDLLAKPESWTMERQMWLQLLIKVALQLFQYVPKQVTLLVWGQPANRESTHHLQKLVTTLLGITATKGIPAHCLPLVGTAVAFLIGLAPSSREGATIFVGVLSALGSDEEVTIGNMTVTAKPGSSSMDSCKVHKEVQGDGKNAFRSFGHLSLLIGLLPCTTPQLLWQSVSQTEYMVTWLFHMISDLCEVPEYQHHSFHLLTLWYQKVSKCFQQLKMKMIEPLFCRKSPFVSRTVKLVWTHLESPVDGITESVMEAFKTMLKLNLEESNLDSRKVFDDVKNESAAQGTILMEEPDNVGETDTAGSIQQIMAGLEGTSIEFCKASDNAKGEHLRTETSATCLAGDLLQETLQLSWQVKGKHRLLGILLPHVGIYQFLDDEKDALPQLLQCLHANHLAPSATALYQILLQELCSDPHIENIGSVEGFSRHCLPVLIIGLTSPHSLLRQNTAHYWLPVTLKHLPWSYTALVDHLLTRRFEQGHLASNDGTNHDLHALIAVLKAGRALQLMRELPQEIICEALRHQEDDIRLDAFSVICVAQKKAEPLTSEELQLLKDSLPYNMTNDSAPFRQQLQTSIRSALVRLRDSALAWIKADAGRGHQKELSGNIRNALEFLDWLWCLTMKSLCPGSSYQRLKTALDWVTLTLDTFTYQPQRRQRKGITPGAVVQLMEAAHNLRLCHFYTSTNTYLILTCLLHGTDEIREMSAGVLLQFFPWPLPLEALSTSNLDITGHRLLETALRLCNSAKSHESESGALILSMIFQKLLLERGVAYTIDFSDGKFTATEDLTVDRDVSSDAVASQFIWQLANLVEQSVVMATADALKAAQQAPGHGLILTIRRCLSYKGIKFGSREQWQPVIEKVTRVTLQMLDLVLGVLGGRVHSEETAPSFEQMSVSIATTIAESVGESDLTPEELLTSGHQLLMTWCWVNIKECSILLGSLVEHLPITTIQQSGVLTVSDVTTIGDVFLKVLTQCRHRGAIEGCNAGLARYCSHLLLSSDPQLYALPQALLDKVLAQVVRADKAHSVTRRSAGFPLIVTSIVASESKTRQDVLLTRVVTRLLEVISAPVSQTDQQVDMPQVHAMNILKALMKESSVAMAVQRHVAPVVMAAVDGFSSPHWAIRNAATQLFGTLVTRMLGQKKSREDLVNMMTVPEFFTHYPSLEAFFRGHIEIGAADQRAGCGGGLRLQPCVFPVLSILSRLGAASHSQHTFSIEALHTAISQLLNSAIYVVRELAAQAIVALVPRANHVKYLRDVIVALPNNYSIAMVTGYNRIHGNLLLCHSLLETIGSRSVTCHTEVFNKVLSDLSTKHWLASTANPCPCVVSQYFEVVMNVVTKSTMDLPQNIESGLSEHLFAIQNSNGVWEVGKDQLVRPLVSWYMSTSWTKMDGFLKSCLESNNTDLTIACLQQLSLLRQSEDISTSFWKTTQLSLVLYVLTRPYCTLLCEALQLIIDIHTHTGDCNAGQQVAPLWACLLELVEQEPNSRVAGLSVNVMAVVLRHHFDPVLRDHVVAWSELLLQCCEPNMAEWLHLHVARALITLAPFIAENLNQEQPCQSVMTLAVRMFEAGLKLLVNEQSYIRYHAADFVSELQSQAFSHDQVQPMHTTLALELLCVTFGRLLSKSADFLQAAINTMWTSDCLQLHIEKETKTHVEELFEEEDANYYKENIHLASLVGTQLTLHVSNEAIKDSVISMETTLQDLVQHLEDARPLLHRHSTGVLNATCSVQVYSSVWRRLEVATTIIKLTQRIDLIPPSGKRLYSVIAQYMKIPCLHPHLRRQMWQLLNQRKGSSTMAENN